jgi:HK97 family phage major capsid protein
MTEFEQKAEEIRQSAEQAKTEAQAAKAEAAAAKAEAEAVKGKLAEKEAELKTAQTNIDNLDASVKEQAATIKELKEAQKALRSQDFKTAFRAALVEKKADIEKALNNKSQKFDLVIELKTDPAPIGTSAISPNNRLSVAEDPTIYAAVPVANAFIAAFGIRPRTANKLGWIESSSQAVVDYVAELAQNTNLSDVAFSEKTRAFGKLATKMQLSTELEDWFEQLYNYCVNEGIRMIDNKLDAEIAKGAGDDSTYPNKIYGVFPNATAFSALAAGAVQDASYADVLIDAANQIAKEGFNANVALVTWKTYVALKALKDANGNYIFDQAKSLLGGLRVLPTTRLSDTAGVGSNESEAIVADSSCVEIYAGNSFELEFIRNGAYDAYDVYFRKAAQVKIATPNKKGVIKIAALDTAVAALLKDGGNAGALGTIATKVGSIATSAGKVAGAVNESDQIETHPNQA